MTTSRTRSRNPFSGLIDTVSELNRMQDRMHGVDSPAQTRSRTHVDAWTPTTDILTADDRLIVRTELPGVARDDVEVTYSAPTLTISGQRRLAEEEQQATYHTKERSWGRFRRSITLPSGVERNQIAVVLTDGVLEVSVRGFSDAEGPPPLDIG